MQTERTQSTSLAAAEGAGNFRFFHEERCDGGARQQSARARTSAMAERGCQELAALVLHVAAELISGAVLVLAPQLFVPGEISVDHTESLRGIGNGALSIVPRRRGHPAAETSTAGPALLAGAIVSWMAARPVRAHGMAALLLYHTRDCANGEAVLNVAPGKQPWQAAGGAAAAATVAVAAAAAAEGHVQLRPQKGLLQLQQLQQLRPQKVAKQGLLAYS
eukprot:scaffold15758_cov63-Phaeocystis_antarctica.AAC.4